MAMQLASDLHIDIDEVLKWDATKFERWVAFFRIKADRAKSRQGK